MGWAPRGGRHSGLRRAAVVMAAALGVGLGALGVRAAIGDRGPARMAFSGNLSNAAGPLSGPHTVRFDLRKATGFCPVPTQSVTVDANGNFVATLDVSGCPGFFDGQNVTYDVAVDGTQMAAGQQLGSVPYAFYADTAVNAAESEASNIARRTTADRTLYVRVDGSNTLCNGAVNASSAPGNAPNCALATVAQALERVPHTGRHTVTILVAAGTYAVSGAGEVLLRHDRQPRVIIRGESATAVTLSGALAGMDTVAVGEHALWVSNGSALTLSDVRVTRFGDAALRATGGAQLTLSNVTVEDSALGLSCERAECLLQGNVTLQRTAGMALRLTGAVFTLAQGASLVVTSAAPAVYAQESTTANFSGSVVLGAITGAGSAVTCTTGTTCRFGGGLSLTGGTGFTGAAVTSDFSSLVRLAGPVGISGVRDGLEALRSATLQMDIPSGGVASVAGITSAGSTGLLASEGGHVLLGPPGTTLQLSGFSSGTRVVYASTLRSQSAVAGGGTAFSCTASALVPGTLALITPPVLCPAARFCTCD